MDDEREWLEYCRDEWKRQSDDEYLSLKLSKSLRLIGQLIFTSGLFMIIEGQGLTGSAVLVGGFAWERFFKYMATNEENDALECEFTALEYQVQIDELEP